ncbi:MAG: hypothetical protein NUV81_02240, partial [bacterium]|nr:hypothetical protein [bacterium]
SGDWKSIPDLFRVLHISETFYDTPEFQTVAKEKMMSSVKSGDWKSIPDLFRVLHIPESFYEDPELQDVARIGYFKKINAKEMDEAERLKELFHLKNRALDIVVRDFGEFATIDLYHEIQGILDGETITEDMAKLGVKHTGEPGVNEMVRGFRGVERLLLDNGDEEVIFESVFARRYLMGQIGFKGAQWGNKSEAGFDELVEQYRGRKAFSPPLPEFYKKSGVVRIAKIDKQEQMNFQFTEAELRRYSISLNALRSAHQRYSADHQVGIKPTDVEGGLFDLQKKMSETRDQMLEQFRSDLDSVQSSDLPEKRKEFAKIGIEQKKARLEAIDLFSIENPQTLFSQLYEFSEFYEPLREIVLYFSLHLNPTYREKDLSKISETNPTLDDLSWMVKFVDHITNQETFHQYFTDKGAAKQFNQLFNISAVEQSIARIQNQKKKGMIPFEFVPTRNLLTELSGHIADACWASKYKSIVEEFPNMISLTMVQNPESEQHLRYVGSAMLIETTSKTGQKLLVIRGLNPKENIINQLDVKDFYESVVTYLQSIAQKLKRKLAIVIDGKRGGSSTNRPVLYTYLAQKRKKLRPVVLKSEKDTTFNNYNIVHDTYFVETV